MQVDLSEHVRDVVSRWDGSTLDVVVQLTVDDDLPEFEGDGGETRDVVEQLIACVRRVVRGGDVVSIACGTQTIEEIHTADLLATAALRPGRFVFVEVRVGDATRRIDLAPLSRSLGTFHGAIRVDSASSVRVLWPVEAPDTAALDARPARDRASEPRGTVLVVDDDASIRELLVDMLGHSGYDVMTAPSGEDGLASFSAHADDIAVVLLDMTMPGMSGEETFRCMRKLRPDARIVVSTGQSVGVAQRRFRDGEIAGILQKPYRYDTLFACLDRACGGRAS